MTTFEYTSITGFDSKAIDKAAYNENNEELYIKFVEGYQYIYVEVPVGVYTDFTEANSAGRFFRDYISGKYNSIRVYEYVTFVAVYPPQRILESPTLISSNYGVKFHINDTGIISESAVEATSEADALDIFHEAIGKVNLDVKVLAVTHYFE